MELDPTVAALLVAESIDEDAIAAGQWRDALQSLPPDQARAFNLRYLRGMMLTEVAAAESVSISTMQKRLTLAVRKLERILGIDVSGTVKSKKPKLPKLSKTRRPSAVNWELRFAEYVASLPESEREVILTAREADTGERADRLRALEELHRESMIDPAAPTVRVPTPSDPQFAAVVGDSWSNTSVHISSRPNNRRMSAVEDRRALTKAASALLRQDKLSKPPVKETEKCLN